MSNQKKKRVFTENEEDCGKMFEGRVEIRSYVLDMVRSRCLFDIHVEIKRAAGDTGLKFRGEF